VGRGVKVWGEGGGERGPIGAELSKRIGFPELVARVEAVVGGAVAAHTIRNGK